MFAVLLFSCGKKDNPKPETNTGFSVVVKQNSKLSTGQVVAKDVNSVIMVWKADGKDFDVNGTDFIEGYALDKNSGTSFKYDYSANNIISQKAPNGRYFVYVVITADGYGQFAHSYTYFNVSDNYVQLSKTFTTNANTLSFEDWNKSE